MTFGIKLQKLRKSQGLSQEQLADILSVTRQAVSKWELDETLPDSENVLKIADMFYMSAEYLLNNNITEQQGKTMVMSANKYDTVNLIAALAALISAGRSGPPSISASGSTAPWPTTSRWTAIPTWLPIWIMRRNWRSFWAKTP